MQPPVNHTLRDSSPTRPEPSSLGHPWAIEINGLSKSFGSCNVLDDLHLNVVQGELLVVLGDSGSGKSTLLKLIIGLERPHRGSIGIHGQEQSRLAPHRRDVAMVFQDGNGYDHLTVRKNLALVAKSSGTQPHIEEWIERLQLSLAMDQRLDQLSGGESQRVAIARAMLSNKSIILWDEPLSHLNPYLRETIRDLILTAHRESGKTFVYVTHDSDEAFYMANRIAVLTAGKIQQVGTPRSVYRESNSKAVAISLGQPTIDFLKLQPSKIANQSYGGNEVLECGVRCHDWTIERLSVEISPGLHDYPATGLHLSNSELILKGAIQACRWMGNCWLLDIECEGKLRIICDSIQEGEMESSLMRAEQLSKMQGTPKPFGYIEANCPRAMLQWFGDTGTT